MAATAFYAMAVSALFFLVYIEHMAKPCKLSPQILQIDRHVNMEWTGSRLASFLRLSSSHREAKMPTVSSDGAPGSNRETVCPKIILA
jgi:hypothetical protein